MSFTSLLEFVASDGSLQALSVIPRLVKFIDNLTNWYVRMNRRRLKGETGFQDCKAALDSLFPSFRPWCGSWLHPSTEMMYQQLKKSPSFGGADFKSVTTSCCPRPQGFIHVNIERAAARMQSVIDTEVGVLRTGRRCPTSTRCPRW